MTTRRPLVLNNGLVSELLDGDTVSAGTSTTEVIAGSGLAGGGPISSSPQLDVALAPNPSGVIYVGDALGLDGVAQATANTALASGSDAAVLASNALASGNNSLVVGTAALASGNAALGLVPTLTGGGPLQTRLVAGSAVASGNIVGVDDGGRVQAVRTQTIEGPSFPSPAVVFESADSAYISTSYDSTNNRVIVAYQDVANSLYGTAVVGTVSGTSISFGTAVVFESASTYDIYTVYNSAANRVVIVYQDAGNISYGTAIVGTVSGTSVSFGTAVVFNSGSTSSISATYDSTNNRVVISYRNAASGGFLTSIVGTVSGTSISFGTAVVFLSANSGGTSITYDSSNNKVVVAYRDSTNSLYGTAKVGTVSGTSISFGTAVVFESADCAYLSTTYDSTNGKVIISYEDLGNASYGTTVVGTVSGTSISFGTAIVFASGRSDYISTTYDFTSNRVVITYQGAGSSRLGYITVGSVSGTSISFFGTVLFASARTEYISTVYNSTNNRVVIAYRDAGNLNYGTAIVSDALYSQFYYPTINSFLNVLGISQSTVASGSPCLVNLPGSLYNRPAANLTPGAFYYADPATSSITTTTTKPSYWNGQVPWNYIGRAVSTSGLMLLKSI